MTRERLVREIEHFRARVAECEPRRSTPREKAAYTRALHAMRQRERMLLALDTTGSISNWTSVGIGPFYNDGEIRIERPSGAPGSQHR